MDTDITNISQEFDDILNSFTKKISSLNNFKVHMEESTEQSREHYIELHGESKEEYIIGGNTASYFDIQKGTSECLEVTLNKFSDIMSTISIYENKQYQWLLVDAYEAYEDFLDEFYAYIGFIDNNFWMAKDYGSLAIDEIAKQNKEWFSIRVKDIRGRPNIIYKQTRKKISLLNYYEKKNQLGIDLQFEINLISKLRHVIVHNGGIIKDRDKFYDSVLNEVGLGPNNPTRKNYEGEINHYIGTNKTYNRLEVILFKHQIKEGQPGYIDRLDSHIGTLLSYAILLTSLTKKHLKGKG